MFENELKQACEQIRNFNRNSQRPITAEDILPRKRTLSAWKWALTSLVMALVWHQRHNLSLTGACMAKLPSSLTSAFVAERNCEFCRNITAVERVRNLMPEQFVKRFAYTRVPVIVEDGTLNWTAPDVFSLDYFRALYTDSYKSPAESRKNCQFFPYRSEFTSLRQVLEMSGERSKHPWYVGWSNCDLEIANRLRSHYTKPYFLPNDSESIRTDWIFMGTPGNGAHMHIDHVGRASWQAQIRGSKVWYLEPPLECFTECHDLMAQVDSGQIIVLDTNVWYHRTLIVGKETSITIGAEYD